MLNKFKTAHQFLIENFYRLKFIFMTFIFLEVVDVFIDFFIPKEFETAKLIFQLIIFLLTIVNNVFYLRILKRDSKAGDFWYILIPFLLYSIYYSFLTIFLIFPLVLLYFMPIVASFTDKIKPFKGAYLIFKRFKQETLILGLMTLILEILPFLASLVFKDNVTQIAIRILLGPITAYFIILFGQISIELFYTYISEQELL